MSSIMRARSGLMGRGEPSEVMGLSRAEGCWTFDARDRMPRPSRAIAHHLSEIAPTATPAPLPRAGSLFDPNVWCGRALQEVWSICRFAVLHQCIRPLIGACAVRATMDISAHTFSLAVRPRVGHLG